MQNSKKQVLIQFIENTLAYALPVFLLQFVVYPLIAKKLGSELNGLFLTMIALNYFVTNITATVLANTRLLLNQKYQESGERGDFNILFLIFSLVNTIIICVATFWYKGGTVTAQDLGFSVVVILLFLYHDYVTAQYRLQLQFRKIFFNNLILCAGYLIGLVVFYHFLPVWQVVFMIPYIMTAIYDMCNTDFIREPLRITPLFSVTTKQYFILAGSSLLSTAVTYGDRLILYPLMDGTSVSIFTSAQLVGKLLQMISTPLSSFMLSYLVKRKTMKLSISFKHILLVIGLGCVMYAGCLIVGNPMIRLLYSEWAEQSLYYVYFTAATGVLHMLVVLTNVILLRFTKSSWQIVKSVTYLCAYMFLSFPLLRVYGLMGFCVGNLLASAIELALILAVLFKEKVIVLK